MGVVGTIVDVHVLNESATQTIFGEHTFHDADEEGVHAGLDVLVERFLHQDLGSEFTLTAGITGIVQIDFVGELLAGEYNLVGVDDDDIVTALHVGAVGGFVFAAEEFGDFCAKTTENLVGGIDYNPLVIDALRVGE